MLRVVLLARMVAMVIMTGVAAAPAAAQPTFSSGVNLVSLMVAVVDGDEQYVTGLGVDDFAVFEDDERQELAFFSEGDVPLDLAILLDTSSSMKVDLERVREAAIGFVRTLQPGDRGAVVEFNDRASFLSGFTHDLSTLESAIRQTESTGGTALYNSLYVTLNEFAGLSRDRNRDRDEVRRQAIVVLSDGEDTTSLIDEETVIEQARRAGVRIYTVSLGSQARLTDSRLTGGHHYTSEADRTMTTLARESGARSFFPARAGELPEIYSRIARELASLYVVGYASSRSTGDDYRTIRVQILTRSNAFARTRAGYYYPSSRSR